MNWDAIGAVGEIVGAIAVIATLVYLAHQIRIASISGQASSTYESLNAYGRWRNAVLQNGEIARAIDKANCGEDLSGDEKIQLQTLMDDLFLTSVVASTGNVQWNTMLEGRVVDIEYVAGILNDNRGLIAQWERFRDLAQLVSPEYVKILDSRLIELGIVQHDQPST